MYQEMPSSVTLMPASLFRGIASLNSRHPPARMKIILEWPMMLNVRLDVAPMTRIVDRLTSTPSSAETRMALTDIAEYGKPNTVWSLGTAGLPNGSRSGTNASNSAVACGVYACSQNSQRPGRGPHAERAWEESWVSMKRHG
jgi:hypothetical protein